MTVVDSLQDLGCARHLPRLAYIANPAVTSAATSAHEYSARGGEGIIYICPQHCHNTCMFYK